jgi:hypothetical protein
MSGYCSMHATNSPCIECALNRQTTMLNIASENRTQAIVDAIEGKAKSKSIPVEMRPPPSILTRARRFLRREWSWWTL